MQAKELESLLKNTLKQYAVDYNNINPKNKVDFNVTFTVHKFNANDIPDYDPKDEKFAKAKAMDGKNLYYLRLSKTLMDTKEKRVIFTTYRPEKGFKKADAQRLMLMECLKQLMIGGLEYSEAIYRMNRAEEAQKEDQTEPQGQPV